MRAYFNWRTLLILFTGLVVIGSFYYFNKLVQNMATVERKRVETTIKGMQFISSAPPNTDITFASDVVTTDTTVPLIMVDDAGAIQEYLYLDSVKVKEDPDYLKKELEKFKKLHPPVVSDFLFGKNYIYYGESDLLQKIRIFPFVQIGLLLVVVLILLVAIYNTQKRLQNQVWVGLAKETAHQLGTPLSSIVGWMEFLKDDREKSPYVMEMEKDVTRLQLIAERFSKIGSDPQLSEENLVPRLQNMVRYMQARSPKNVQIQFVNLSGVENISLMLNGPLFDWVIENLMRNALDALEGKGNITVELRNEQTEAVIDVSDSGKGIPRKNFKKVFYPGFSTKKRGWGLGLSLAKRIIEQYHHGRIFVRHSEPKTGTTFRIILNR